MSKSKRIGIILILVGIFLPLISLGFTSGRLSPKLPFPFNIFALKVVLKEPVYENILDVVARDSITINRINEAVQKSGLYTQPSRKDGMMTVEIMQYNIGVYFPANTPNDVMQRVLRENFPPDQNPKVDISKTSEFKLSGKDGNFLRLIEYVYNPLTQKLDKLKEPTWELREMSLSFFRELFPEYNDLSDKDLLNSLQRKFGDRAEVVKNEIFVSYKFIFILSIALTFLGLGFVLLTANRKEKDTK